MFSIISVRGISMFPTLEDSEQVLAWTPFHHSLFRRNMIVTVQHVNVQMTERLLEIGRNNFPTEWSELLIKRLIGLPGDTVRIPKHKVKSDYMDNHAIQTDSAFIWHVPAGHVFVRGDGRTSVDSTTWGCIPINELQQIVMCRFPSLSAVRRQEAPSA